MALELDDSPSGLGWLPGGDLLVVSMVRRALLRVGADGPRLHADLAGSTRFRPTTCSSTRRAGPT